jgi:hypothetical protein
MTTPAISKITLEQQQALDSLVALIHRPQSLPESDLLKTWLGISQQDIAGFIHDLLSRKDVLETRLLDWTEHRPLDAVFEFLATASLAFYTAEKATNPKIKTYFDAFYYIATCASVGYADIFAVTQTGRSIASLVMIVGPALTSRSLERSK